MNEQQKKDFKIINGDSLKVLDTIEENSIDAIITDPPYGLTSITKRFGKENSKPAKYGKDGSFARLSKGFMGKEWDGSGIEYNVELWQKALRVLKPGGYLLAFGGTRTVHRIACAIEDAGFEIRDTIMWLYGSGFPKSLNIGLAIDKKNGVDNRTGEKIKGVGSNNTNSMKNGLGESQQFKECFEERKATNEWAGWGTCLKPSYEPIIVARKPFKGSLVDNVLEYRVGGLNIDECRVDTKEIIEKGRNGRTKKSTFQSSETNAEEREYQDNGRFPANTILTYDETDFDEVCGGMPYTKSNASEPNNEKTTSNMNVPFADHKSGLHYEDEGSACRYFYCAKATKKDRDDGLINFEERDAKSLINREDGSNGASWNGKYSSGNAFAGAGAIKKNIHPTVKPVELMQYLVRLVSPKGATILDIFNGSGSTGKAVAFENRERDAHYKYIGIELDKEYCVISESRIDYALNKFEYDILEDIKESNDNGEINLFEFL